VCWLAGLKVSSLKLVTARKICYVLSFKSFASHQSAEVEGYFTRELNKWWLPVLTRYFYRNFSILRHQNEVN
jgi:hypothetical protein